MVRNPMELPVFPMLLGTLVLYDRIGLVEQSPTRLRPFVSKLGAFALIRATTLPFVLDATFRNLKRNEERHVHFEHNRVEFA
jgi:hypothetical protein